MVWIEYLFILDLTPASVANVYNSSFMVSMLNDMMVSSIRQKTFILFYILAIMLITVSYAFVIFSSVCILQHDNYVKMGYITINKSIHINDVRNLSPFLHTIKNQLVSLIQFENLLRKDNFDEIYPIIVSITEEVSTLIDNLYDNSKDIKLNLMMCDVGVILEEAIKKISTVSDINIEFKYTKHVWAMIDQDYMQHAFENILYNSVDACDGKSDGKITVSVNGQAHFIRVVISDNGIGISRESIKKIFEPFFSTKCCTHSWGMGLNHVSKIIKAHNGHVFLQSEPGMGTDVTIRIPTGW